MIYTQVWRHTVVMYDGNADHWTVENSELLSHKVSMSGNELEIEHERLPAPDEVDVSTSRFETLRRIHVFMDDRTTGRPLFTVDIQY